jgi:leader peptidase (prepilin peptidase) / N-methyltransferase
MVVAGLLGLGLLLGSFTCMLVFRLPRELPLVFDRSRCGACKRPISGLALIPLLGFFISKGRCPSCLEKIPRAYVFIELFMPALLLTLYTYFGFSDLFFLSFFFIWLGFIHIIIDSEHYLLLDKINIGLLCLAGVKAGLYAMWIPFFEGGLSSLCIFLFLYYASAWWYKRPALGLGDVKTAAVLAAFLGLHASLNMIYFSFLFGGAAGVFVFLFQLKKKEDALPFGPYLILASWLVYFRPDLLLF